MTPREFEAILDRFNRREKLAWTHTAHVVCAIVNQYSKKRITVDDLLKSKR